jgi:hypothetical protein
MECGLSAVRCAGKVRGVIRDLAGAGLTQADLDMGLPDEIEAALP